MYFKSICILNLTIHYHHFIIAVNCVVVINFNLDLLTYSSFLVLFVPFYIFMFQSGIDHRLCPFFRLILSLVTAFLWQRTWQSVQTPPDSKVVGWIGLLLNSGQSEASFPLTMMALDANKRVKMEGAWGQV